MRTQLALRELAISLAEEGQHVVRFDYRGTGDSFCDLDEVAISDWLEDIALVVREGRAISGCSEVRLLGVRAGALLICRSASASGDVRSIGAVGSSPDGGRYLQTLRRIQVGIVERDLSWGRSRGRDALNEYAGYRLSKRMQEEFRLLDVDAFSSVPQGKLQVVSTSRDAGVPVLQGVPQVAAPFACNWETELDDLMMPKRVLERLRECLTRS